jgi:two-component system, OmpR family, sensor histidine kinase AdeS
MSKVRKPLSLKVMFALASTACVFVTVLIGYFGLTAYAEIQLNGIKATMPAAAKRAQDALDARQIPAVDDTKALMVFADKLEDNFEVQQNVALLILSLFAASLGAVLSLFLADRLARPIAEVAAAARKIARGELSARANSPDSGIGESAQLITDFNQMATALEGFDREMSESSAAIAHELRTPLTVLRGYVQGAIDGVFPPTQEHLARLMVHIESLSRVVDDLQTLSLAKNGALSVAMEPMDASEEIGRLLDAMEPAIGAAGVTLERSLETAVTLGDAVRLRQAVSALIDNARHYAASGGVISVQTRATREGVVVRVLDRGPGLPDAHLSRGFDRFWRGEPSRGKASGGSGLGLSVVKAIVTAHGGEVRMVNRPSGGLSVEMTLPNIRKPLTKS